jgi:hypothetical protein
MKNSLGVSDPQTVFLSKVSPVRTQIGEEPMFGCLAIDAPQEVLSNARCCRTWSGNCSRPLLLQRPSKPTYVLQHPTFTCTDLVSNELSRVGTGRTMEERRILGPWDIAERNPGGSPVCCVRGGGSPAQSGPLGVTHIQQESKGTLDKVVRRQFKVSRAHRRPPLRFKGRWEENTGEKVAV